MANYTATIGGQLVTVVAGTVNVTKEVGQRSTGSIGVWTPLGTVYQYGTRVLIFDDVGALVYSGFTTKDKVTKGPARQGTGLLEHTIQLMDNCYKADKIRVFKSYLNIPAGYQPGTQGTGIVWDLLNTYLVLEGVTGSSATIAVGPTIPEVIWNGSKSVAEALTWLATQAGYWWQIDVNSVLFFQPYGGVPAPIILDGTQVDATKNLSVELGNDQYVNRQFVKGSFASKGTKAAPLVETLHGNGVTRSFTLSYEVNSILTNGGIVVNGQDQTAQSLTKGSTGGSWYFAKGDAVIAQDPGQTVLQSSDTLVVSYIGRYPVIALAQNQSLVTAQQAREGGGTGRVEATYTNTKVRTLSGAYGIAYAQLAHYGQDATILEFDTRTKGLQPGQMLTVNLPDFGLTGNKQMLISAVTISDQDDGFNIWFHVKCVGSPLEQAQWQTYWAGLMQQNSDPSDYTDTADTALAPLFASTFTAPSHNFTVTRSGAVCPIIGNSTIVSNTLIVC